jgi:serine/threonine protein kinase
MNMNSPGKYQEDAEPELFELLKGLGAGGFAHTYSARVLDEELIRDYGTDRVAIKVPLSLKKQRVLTHEVELNAALWMRLRALKSMHLCRYLGIAVFRGQIVMVMEYCPDGSLRRILGDFWHQKRIPVDDAVGIAQGVLRGLMVIHGERIFHRDIKPENVLMDGDTPKISDLGIAKMIKSNEMASSTVGTIYYMSPEMLGKEGASFPSDIWSLGVTLYEMVTGCLPFGTEEMGVGELVDLIRSAEHRRARDVCPDVPQWLDDVIETSLQKRTSDRYQSADEMLDALTRRKKKDDTDGEIAEIEKLARSGDPGPSVEARIRGFVDKHPEDARGYHYLGQYYTRCQLSREAAEAFQHGIRVVPDDAQLHWDLALVLQSAGHRGEAAQHLERALALNLAPSLRQPAATLLKALKGDDRAHVVAVSAGPKQKNEAFEQDLAPIRELMSREECEQKAASELRRLVKKYPDNPQAYQHLGEHLNRCQMHREAVEAFRKGLDLDASNALLHWDLALAYQRMGRRADAAKHLQQAMSLDLDAGLRQHAARLLKTLGSST